MPGTRPTFTSIGIGLDGTTWVADDTQRVKQLFGTASASLNDPRAIAKIAVASASQIWGLDAAGQPVSLQSGSGAWTNLGTATLGSIDGAPDGTVCGVELVAQQSPPGTPPPPPIGRPVQWNGGSWSPMGAATATQIAVGDRNSIWMIDLNGGVQRWQPPGNWQPMPALPSFTTPEGEFNPTAIRLCAGTDGSLCVVGSYDYVYRLKPNASAWDFFSSTKLTEIAGANGTDYAGLTLGETSRSGKSINDVVVWGYSLQTMPPTPPALSWRTGVGGWGGNYVNVLPPAVVAFNGSLYLATQAMGDNPAARFLYWGGLSSPATGFAAIGSAPALATFQGALYCAFQAYDPAHPLCVTRTYDGAFWWPPANIPGIQIGSAPALAEFQERLYCAFQANDPSNNLFVASTGDGENWGTSAQPVGGVTIASAPALAAFKGNLYCAFQDNVTGALGMIRSADGQNWASAANGIGGSAIGSAPTLVVFNGRLYCGYRANDGRHPLCLTSSADGANWEQPHRYDEMNVPLAAQPSLCAIGKTLYALLAPSDTGMAQIVLCAADA